ncbi:DUF3817 domain-containing protein [Brevibacillus sp. M2.1A]|uniref:DUF3817 domain-containing protein n=1 Tax=Brevibacillus sp. M2.1A TaxID=2738980 RepID=UPI00156A8813|nr:DUF3817 domain-containing protein [Brevibacillus sp. M2.1A]MCC8438553.1 DUF3817 domain-containing protein [Brevibacillus sp. M2.1A]
MINTAIGRFRIIGFIEGISYLILLGIAMPLKYYLDAPATVKVVGLLHGWLFLLYILALAHVAFKKRWSILKVIGAFIASLIPFGNFVLDVRLKKEQ